MKSEYKDIKNKLDAIFAKYIVYRDKRCIVCNSIDNLTCGHYYDRNILSLRWDEFNCNAQCIWCNNMHEINRSAYYDALLKKYGLRAILELDKKRRQKIKLEVYQIEEMYDRYLKLYNEVKKEI